MVLAQVLRTAPSARKDNTVGQMVNLVSVDAQRYMDQCWYLHLAWASPLEICVAFVFLYDLLGIFTSIKTCLKGYENLR
jgi:hypothetical protein